MLADITGKKLCLVQNEDASATGAAYMGMKAIKIIGNYQSLPEENKKEIFPDKNLKTVYKKNSEIFTKLYPALKDLMQQDQTII